MKKGSQPAGAVADIKASMGDLVAEAAAVLRKTSSAFRRSRPEEIRDLGPDSSRAGMIGSGLINSARELSGADDHVKKSLIGAIGNLERICACSEEMTVTVREKIERDILFSIQAFGECNELFAEALCSTEALGKLLRGEVGRGEVEGLCRGLERLVCESGLGHEERLVQGVCAVKASNLFMGMLDLFRAIAFHSSQAASGVEEASSG